MVVLRASVEEGKTNKHHIFGLLCRECAWTPSNNKVHIYSPLFVYRRQARSVYLGKSDRQHKQACQSGHKKITIKSKHPPGSALPSTLVLFTQFSSDFDIKQLWVTKRHTAHDWYLLSFIPHCNIWPQVLLKGYARLRHSGLWKLCL